MTATTKRAVIVAAGRGRRLMPYTDLMPKCLVPLRDRPILAYQLDAYRAVGVEEFVIVRGYLANVLEARKAELGPGVRFVENREWADNNILESLFCAESAVEGAFYLSYADIVFGADTTRALAASTADVALVVDRDFARAYVGRSEHPLEEAEVCSVDAGGAITQVGKRSVPASDAWGEFIGLAKLGAAGATALRSAWKDAQKSHGPDTPFVRAPRFRQAYLTDLLQVLIDGGMRLEPVPIHGRWREIDTVQDRERAEAAGDWL